MMSGLPPNVADMSAEVPFYRAASVKYEPGEWVALGKAGEPGTFEPVADAVRERWVQRFNVVDVSQVPPTLVTVAFLWKCPQGHEWREPMGSVTDRQAKWKRLDPSGRVGPACRACVLERYALTYEGCGHRHDDLGKVADPPLTVPQSLCPTCHPELLEEKARRQENAERRWEQRARRLQTLREAVDARKRLWETQMPERGYDKPPGSIEWKFDRHGSALETTVIDALRDAGLPVMTCRAVRVPNLMEQSGETWLCTPDGLINERWCIEVDSPGWKHRLTCHNSGFPAHDLYRDDCLRAVGMVVIRLRLAGLEPVPDSINYVTDRDYVTKAILAEFAALVRETIASDGGQGS